MTTATLNSPVKQRMTVEEFLDFCERPENEDKLFELLRGEVIEVPPPMPLHGVVCSNIATELTLHARLRRKGHVATNDSAVRFADDSVLGPDVAYFEHIDKYRDLGPRPAETPPTLAVEVLSPSDSFRKVSKKIERYLSAGVKMVWLVDPEEETISVYRPNEQWKVFSADQQLVGDPELPGFSHRVANFFLLPGELPVAEAT